MVASEIKKVFKVLLRIIFKALEKWIWPFVNLGIGIGIETDIINALIYISIRPMAPKLSRVVTQDEGTTPINSRDTSITWSCGK